MVHVSSLSFTLLTRFGRRLTLVFLLTVSVFGVAAAQDTAGVGSTPAGQVPIVPGSVAPAPASEAAPVVLFRQPAYPGTPAELNKFLKQNLRYPAEVAEAHISGRVMVSFWVDETGRAYGFGAVQSPHPALEAEALRVVRKIPRWVPGLQDGHPAPMQLYLPVVFKL